MKEFEVERLFIQRNDCLDEFTQKIPLGKVQADNAEEAIKIAKKKNGFKERKNYYEKFNYLTNCYEKIKYIAKEIVQPRQLSIFEIESIWD